MLSVLNRVMDVNANRTRHARACQCHWGRTGLGLQMPLGPSRPGLVHAHGPGRALTCQCPWDRAGLDLLMPMGPDRH